MRSHSAPGKIARATDASARVLPEDAHVVPLASNSPMTANRSLRITSNRVVMVTVVSVASPARALALEHFPRPGCRRLSVIHHELAIHQYEVDPGAELEWLEIRGMIAQ